LWRPNGHLTRVPTQITCKFLKSAPANSAPGRTREFTPEPLVCRHVAMPHEPARAALWGPPEVGGAQYSGPFPGVNGTGQ